MERSHVSSIYWKTYSWWSSISVINLQSTFSFEIIFNSNHSIKIYSTKNIFQQNVIDMATLEIRGIMHILLTFCVSITKKVLNKSIRKQLVRRRSVIDHLHFGDLRIYLWSITGWLQGNGKLTGLNICNWPTVTMVWTWSGARNLTKHGWDGIQVSRKKHLEINDAPFH